ncbi:MAG: carboxylating nicotinate-nucleotide diphosphorylase [Desulfobacteraceae bacterium]
MLLSNHIHKLIAMALEEDIGSGDVTTEHLVTAQAMGHAVIVAKEDLIISGLDVARRVFECIDPGVVFEAQFQDGDRIQTGQTVVELSGRLCTLLTGERTALNFLQRLSGIATHVRCYVEMLEEKPVKLLDTRKTTPGWRELEKYAVRTGGADNHRMGLYDAVLIKDNHIAAAGGIGRAVQSIRAAVGETMTIEVETTNMDEVRDAVDAGAHIIMLDNMDLDQIRAAIKWVDGRAKLEVSGGITRKHLADLADTGIDFISSGALTHSARAVDLSMRIS